ncbi:hypothetical protein GCM10022239_03460 [Leifsonia bigeumensis]|uniref:Uncharacterized protein n=1 Tax=Leifsonella bigeumensis TaxID=433643 RepID=A0ABP7F2U8_9MICO
MSAATKAALDDAIAAHVADELDGALLTNYVGVAAAVKPEDSDQMTYYLRVAAEQPIHVSIGLTEYLANRLALSVADDPEE